jgi:hypothetical protein
MHTHQQTSSLHLVDTRSYTTVHRAHVDFMRAASTHIEGQMNQHEKAMQNVCCVALDDVRELNSYMCY